MKNKSSKAMKQNIILIGIFMAFSLLVFISATITLGNANSVNTNTTYENNFTHLNVSNSSIVGYWSFDENYNSTYTFDYTNNSNDGTLVGGTIINTTGCVYGNCYTFDGANDYINTADINALDGITQMTTSVWIKLTSTSVVTDTIIAKWDYSTQGSWGLQLDNTNVDELQTFIAP